VASGGCHALRGKKARVADAKRRLQLIKDAVLTLYDDLIEMLLDDRLSPHDFSILFVRSYPYCSEFMSDKAEKLLTPLWMAAEDVVPDSEGEHLREVAAQVLKQIRPLWLKTT
jgi:hypothetical protein